ncbi:LVIVD repeat-containing protein [Hymenobacter jeollabukensis]|uniref:Uncharacterized protein n=1 Tax=Hymenobacter jeollabukensis TaxID=2025313 RepID=A0A5R8WRI9_9BACT|nr:hypothetical protein [Hymenobacter jeollabukensis]TLM93032.1 hypothetical protein FDY95_10365 [Hymenobacter jeollabukensis]
MSKLSVLLSFCALLLLPGCYVKQDDPKSTSLPVYRPLLMTRAHLEQAVALLPPRDVQAPGKTYCRGSYLLVNEQYEGIHIIDNQDPARPRKVGFLRIPGSLDVAMRGPVLYADNAVDLVTIDLTDPANARVLGRVRNVFPELPLPETASIEPGYRAENRPPDAVVVGWQKVQ